MKKHIISTLLASTLLVACSDEPVEPPTACLTLLEEVKTFTEEFPEEMRQQIPIEKLEKMNKEYIEKWDTMPAIQRKATLKQCESKLEEFRKQKALVEQLNQ